MIEELNKIVAFLFSGREEYKGISLFCKLCQTNPEFFTLVREGILVETIKPFSDQDWDKINNQNIRGIDNFETVFKLGLNIGNCTNASRQLSYSYNDVSLCSGTNDFLIGTQNALSGEHSWLEDRNDIIDTTLMVRINKIWSAKFKYNLEVIFSPSDLSGSPIYSAAKEFANDPYIKQNKKR